MSAPAAGVLAAPAASSGRAMVPRDRMLAVLVAVLWGLNFPATAIALDHFPPLLMAAVRFAVIAVPTVLLVPRPRIPFHRLALVGLGLGVAQFGLFYLGVANGMPPGLASIVIQASAPFTIIIAGVWLKERISRRQGAAIVVAGLALLAIAVVRSQSAPVAAIVLTLGGALGWAFGNVATRLASGPPPLHLTLWWSVIPPLPLLALSFVFEGSHAIVGTMTTLGTPEGLRSSIGLAYIVIFSSVIAYALWSGLMTRYPSSTVAPFSMMVPVVGVLSSWLVVGDRPVLVEVLLGAVIILAVLLGSRRGLVVGADSADGAPEPPRPRPMEEPVSEHPPGTFNLGR